MRAPKDLFSTAKPGRRAARFDLAIRAIAGSLILAAGSASAQTPAPVKTEPPVAPSSTPSAPPATDESDVERAMRELEAAGSRPAAVPPTTVGGVEVKTGTGGRAGPVLLREGTFLLNRRGRLAAGTQPVFVFDADERGRAEAPMALLPCEHLATLQHTARRAAATGGSAGFIVSGQVMVYRGRNYLLLTRPAQVVRAAAPATTTAEPAREPGAATGAPAGSAEAQRSMSDLEAAAPARPILPPAASDSVGTEGERARITAAYREGTFIASRRGRLARGVGGALALVFDADAGAAADAPLLLMPCTNLTALEDLSARGGDGVSISVSGPVYTHAGQSFLLPTMYVIQPRAAR